MTKASKRTFTLGLDFGTSEARALIVDTADGREIATAASRYPGGKDGVITHPADPLLARQHPRDYATCFNKAVKSAVTKADKVRGFDREAVVGIGVATTGSTPIPIGRDGRALAAQRTFMNDPAAMAWLWKDHTAHEEAAEITTKARESRQPYLGKCGGSYSAEWFWSKVLHCSRHAPKVFGAAHTWLELADYVPYLVTGADDPVAFKRGICAAGHKAMYHDEWQGLPGRGFLASLSPALASLRDRMGEKAYPSDEPAGRLDAKVAKAVGLPAGIPVAVGTLDAHAGAVGAGIRPGCLVKILGTSSCDMMVVPLSRNLVDIPGLCGIVPHSIVPGMYGLEAGQSAVGDVFNWFIENAAPAEYTAKGDPHDNLAKDAAKLKPGESGLLGLDWHNGNRTVLSDPQLTGLMLGQTIHTTAPETYRALIEASAFGALTIMKRLEQYGVKIGEVVACGGIAEKNPFVMQVYADVCNRPFEAVQAAHTCALGAAIFGAVIGGAYKKTEAAQKRMVNPKTTTFKPQPRAAAVYDRIFKVYRMVHDALGTQEFKGDLYRIMKDMIAIRDEVRRSQ